MEAAERFSVKSTLTGDVVEILHNAELSTLRREVLTSAADLIWAPLLLNWTGARACRPIGAKSCGRRCFVAQCW